MNSKFHWAFAVVVALIIAVLVIPTFWGVVAARADSNVKNSLVGTWRVHMTPRNCQTGVAMPPFDFLVSFARGGTLSEVTNSPAFAPGQRTTGFGIWSREHRNTYKSVSEAFILADVNPVIPRGSQRLSWDLEVYGDQATIESSGQFLDVNGNLAAESCASGTASRFEGADDEE